MSPQKKNTAFTSMRILGKKAQNMLEKAKKSMEKPEEKMPSRRKKLPEQKQEMIMHVSTQSVAKAALTILAIGLCAWFLFVIRSKIILLVLAAFVATVIDPGVQRLEQWKVPRGLGILIHYFLAIFLIIYLLVSLGPDIADQIELIAININTVLQPFLNDPVVQIPFFPNEINKRLTEVARIGLQNMSLEQIVSSLRQTGQSFQDVGDIATKSVQFAVSIAGSVLNFVVNLIIVLVLAFFMQMEKERIIGWVRSYIPEKYLPYANDKTDAIHSKIGQWMRGELMLMFSIFTLTFVALLILGLGDYALTLAILAGFMELIPAVGPFLAAIPAILIGGTQNGFIWIPIIAGVYYVIQWCENNLLVPLIMKRAVGLSPVAILFAMLVGISFPDTIHPVLGVMLAIPTTTILALFLEDWRSKR